MPAFPTDYDRSLDTHTKRETAYGLLRITQGGYALVDLLARSDLSDRVSLSANLKNATNHKYLSALNCDQGFYGVPRTILGTISFKY